MLSLHSVDFDRDDCHSDFGAYFGESQGRAVAHHFCISSFPPIQMGNAGEAYSRLLRKKLVLSIDGFCIFALAWKIDKK